MYFAKEFTIMRTPNLSTSLDLYKELCFLVSRTHSYGRGHMYFEKDIDFAQNTCTLLYSHA